MGPPGPEDTTWTQQIEFALKPDSTNRPLTRIPASQGYGFKKEELIADFYISRSR